MNTEMSDHEKSPCIRGCTWAPTMEGENPRPKPANHGQLCDSCFYRMKHALKLVPDLMANMRLAVTPAANFELTDRVQGGGDGWPAPLRIGPLDSSDALFSKLVSWVDAIAQQLNATPPSIRVWMGFSEPQGSRPVSPVAAHDQAAQLTSWFLVRLEDIAESPSAAPFHDDISWGWEDSPGVYKLTGQFGSEERKPRPSDKRECPICGKREVFVAHPSTFNPDPMILCGLCGWLADIEKYKGAAEMFREAS